jgi:hypothetical protein
VWLIALNPGCGTAAVGIDDCRDIEQARCDAAAACRDRRPAPWREACESPSFRAHSEHVKFLHAETAIFRPCARENFAHASGP